MSNSTAPARERIAHLVDTGDFRTLFVEELGWSNPDRPARTVTVGDTTYALTQVAGHKGLRVWQCPVLPPRRVQRIIDAELGRDNAERLLVFSDGSRQEWRWPRKAQTGGVNAKLLVHAHVVGERNDALTTRLAAIALDFTIDVPLVDLLARMRAAFDAESETASAQAARLMNRLYEELEASQVSEHDSTLLLARLLFLLFADDSDMWVQRPDLFATYLQQHTSTQTLHTDLRDLFRTLNTDERDRHLAPGSPLSVFRYVNGGLFADEGLTLPPLTAGFRNNLIEACSFDWSNISPAVFGSMFQTVKDKDARREGGEHYTTEVNILKTLGPLFLDELKDRLDSGWDDKGKLTRLHNDLGKLRVMDPACGCGNFLIVAYRELRALELEVLKRRRDLDVISGIHTGGVNRSQLTLDVTADQKVRLDHFAGIEIDEWPARIATTAMLLVDHLANQSMAEEFGMAPDRLPIRIAPAIRRSNALRTDWATLVAPSDDLVIVGNPPFVGMNRMTKEQQDDNRHVFTTLGISGLRTGRLDYVACWYAKALAHLQGTRGRAAFVSTNSLIQGEQARTMVPLLAHFGAKVDFGHRTFRWTSEAPGAAVVHVVVIGMSARNRPGPRRLFEYARVDSNATESRPSKLNFFLVDADDVAPAKAQRPLVRGMPGATQGSKPVDGGGLLVTRQDLEQFADDPIATRYLRPFVQGQELLRGGERWCLWMPGARPEDLDASPILRERMMHVERARVASPTPTFQQQAATPWRFSQNRQPQHAYIALPEVSSENREWVPGAILQPNVIAGNKLIVWDTAERWVFAYLQSSAFMAWVRAYAGRLKSDLSLSPGLVYFTFPFVIPARSELARFEAAADAVLRAREEHPGATLSDLYGNSMPSNVRAAHDGVDAVVDDMFGLERPTESARMRVLTQRYQELVSAPPRRR